MFNQSVILCTYMHLFNNIELAYTVTAVVIIRNWFPVLSRFGKKVCVIQKIKLVIRCTKNY